MLLSGKVVSQKLKPPTQQSGIKWMEANTEEDQKFDRLLDEFEVEEEEEEEEREPLARLKVGEGVQSERTPTVQAVQVNRTETALHILKPFRKTMSLLQAHISGPKEDPHLSGFVRQTPESVIECQTSEPRTELQTTESGFEWQTSESVFDLLSDEQATTLLLSMDADTLLECGRFLFFTNQLIEERKTCQNDLQQNITILDDYLLCPGPLPSCIGWSVDQMSGGFC